VRRLGQEPRGAVPTARGPRQAELGGFDLHADVWVPGRDRARLERPCRYLLRPPLAQERLGRRGRAGCALHLEAVPGWRRREPGGGAENVWRPGATAAYLTRACWTGACSGLAISRNTSRGRAL
jgi:hypothetical protein